MNSKIKQLSIASITLLIAACSSTPNNTEPYGKGYGLQLQDQQLYAILSKDESNNYSFTSFTTDRPHSNTNRAWIELNQLTPLFSTLSTECAAGVIMDRVVTEENKVCTDIELRERLFQDSTLDTGDIMKSTLGNAALTVITWGVGAVATAGYYTVEFDEDAYIKALNEANANFDIMPILAGLNKFNSDIDQRQQKLDSEIESKQASLDKGIKVSFTDKSKIYGTSPKDIVSVEVSSSQSPLKTVSKLEFNTIEDLYIQLDKKEAEVRGDVVFQTSCKTSLFNGWDYSVSGCRFKAGLNDEAMKNVNMTVKSKEEFYIPYLPIMTDKTVVVKAVNGKLTINNKTGKYLRIDSVSMYVGNDIETRTNLNIEVPPEAISTIANLSMFTDSERRRKLHHVDKTSLKHQIKLGAAIKYRIADTNVEKTLYKVDNVTPYSYF
ncbi:hypothetical protein [Vibrio lentus]|uniref:hypothetical protein n=1 Tax=Vibrio lentus TaxID=136468 RepID=UPI000C85CF71|nr:hypothetical protein [Vibrio lentus]PMG64884.1 hypothetical protein BCU86_17185 [Vibrio lentus]